MTTNMREFDPNRKYPLVLSERLKKERDASKDDYELSTVHVDSELKIPSKVTSSQIKSSTYGDDGVSLQLKGAKDGDNHKYSGTEQSSTTLVMVFDPATQTMVLDRVDKNYTFTSEHMGEGSQSGQSDDGMLDALIQQEGEPDQENPYDWRHQLTQRQSSSPELEPFDPLDHDALGSPSPNQRPRRMSRRQASTPPGEISAQSSSHASPEAEQSDQDFKFEIEQDEPKKTQQQRQESEDLDSDEGSDDGSGLQIIGDNPRKFGNHRGRFLGNLEGGPISLRSAASSRSPAPPADESSEESDVDVDEMRLDTVHNDPKPPVEQSEDDGDMDEGFEDLEKDLEEEFEQLEGDDEVEAEASGGVPLGRYVEVSSSESEEE